MMVNHPWNWTPPWIGMKPCMGVRWFLKRGFPWTLKLYKFSKDHLSHVFLKKLDFGQWWTSSSQCASDKLFWHCHVFLVREWFSIRYEFQSFLVWHPSNLNVGKYASKFPEYWTKADIWPNQPLCKDTQIEPSNFPSDNGARVVIFCFVIAHYCFCIFTSKIDNVWL